MLKLQRIEMTNFMCVKHTVLDFTDANVILLVGENGEGKSTVLEAIAFCLNSEHKKSDAFGDYIKEFEHVCNVKLWAEVQNKPIYFDLTVKDTSSTVERLVKYGNPEDEENYKEYKNSEVTTLLEKLGLIYYSDIIMSMQDKGDITALTPAKRAEYLSKLLNFDFSDKVQTLKDELKNIKENIDYNVSQIEFNTKSIEDRKKEIKNIEVLNFTEKDIKSLQEDISKLNGQLNSLSEDIKKKEDLTNKKGTISTEIAKIEQEIITIKTCIKNAQEKKSQIEKLNESKESVKKELQSLITEDDEAETDETEISNEVQKLLSENSDLNAELKIANKNIDLVNKGVCPECGHKFDEGDRKKYEDALKDVTEKLEIVSKNLKEKQDEKSKIVEHNNLIRQLAFKKSQDISNKEKEIENFDRQIELLSSNNNEDYSTALTNKENELSNKKIELSNLEKEISNMPDLGDKQKELSSSINAKQSVLNEYNQKLLQNNMIMQNNQKINDSIADMEKTIEDLKTKIEQHRNRKSNLDEEVQILDKLFPNYLIVKKCKELEMDINKFIQRIFPTMAVCLSQGKKGVELHYTMNKDKYEVLDKENLTSIKMASGFQKAAVSVAFKVSLCIAYGLRFSFFDEIDQAATEKNSDSLLKAIVTNDIFDQTFIITHKPTVRTTIKSVAPKLLTYYVSKGNFSTEEE